jgi:hypothetical protein
MWNLLWDPKYLLLQYQHAMLPTASGPISVVTFHSMAPQAEEPAVQANTANNKGQAPMFDLGQHQLAQNPASWCQSHPNIHLITFFSYFKDGYYSYKPTTKMLTAFITSLFTCPELPPPSNNLTLSGPRLSMTLPVDHTDLNL